MLRVETVINSPREFRVRRTRTRNGKPTKVWCPMNKGVANLGSYQSVCRASNDRYLNALAVVEDPTPAYQQVADLTESKVHQGRRYAGFNPGAKPTSASSGRCCPANTSCGVFATRTFVISCTQSHATRFRTGARRMRSPDSSDGFMYGV